MQELVSDYTIVIVTPHMQQAATGLRPGRRSSPSRCTRRPGTARGRGRVRRDRDDLHEALGSPDRGLRHGGFG